MARMKLDAKQWQRLRAQVGAERLEVEGPSGSGGGGGPIGGVNGKYNAVRTLGEDAVMYDSRAEAHRANELLRLKQSGAIRDYIPHPRFRLGGAENVYIPDFLVLTDQPSTSEAPGEHGGPEGARFWVEDVKGKATAKFIADARRWRLHGSMPLVLLRGVYRRRGERSYIAGFERETIPGRAA